MKAAPPSSPLYLVLVLALGAGIFFLARRGMLADRDLVREVDRTVVAEYVRLVGEGRWGEAWDSCLAKSYRDAVPRERFVAAHEERRRETGALGGAKLLRSDVSRNLFSKTRELQLLYELTYPGGAQPQYVVVNDADGTFRIEGTYHERGDTLGFLLW